MHARRAIALGMVGTALLAAGCGGGDAPDAAQDTARFTSVKAEGSETSSTAETTEPSAERPEDTGAAWKREYEYVLEHPDDYPVNSAAQYTPGGASKYAIVEATGGGTPELLLAVGQGHTNPVIVFTIGPDGKAVASTDVLIIGTPGDGAARESVWAAEDGNGLYQISGSSRSSQALARHFVLDGTSLSKTGERDINKDAPGSEFLGIDWVDPYNRQPLTEGTLTVAPLGGGKASGGAANANATSPAAPAAGQVQLTGTVRAITGAELQAGSGRGMPNGEDPQSVYYVLWFDSPQDVTGKKLTEYVTNRQEYAALGKRETMASGHTHTEGLEWADRVGQRVTLTVDQDGLWYPTDAGMPLGAVRVGPDYSVDVL